MAQRNQRGAVVAVVVLLAAGGGWFAYRSAARPSDRELALRAIEQRDFDAAREHLRRILNEQPGDAEMLLIAGRTERRVGELDAARSLLDRCAAAGGAADAIEFERELIAIQRGNAQLAREKVAFARTEPESERAALALEAMIETGLSIASTGSVRHMPLPDQTLDGTSIPRVRESLELWFARPLNTADRAQGLVWRARLRELSGEHTGAIADLREAMELEPDRKLTRMLFAMFRAQEAPEESRAAMRALAERYPDDAAVQTAWAESLRDAGRGIEARAVLERHPNHTRAQFVRALILLDEEKASEAEPLLQRVVVATPRDPEVHSALSRCMRQLGRAADAARHQERFFELEAERGNPK